MAKKYLDFEGLSTFLNGLFSKFALKKHSHTKSEITDYVVDSAMSSTSTNPVQNKVINSAISSAKTEAMNMATSAASQALTDANSYTNEKVEILTDSIYLKADTSDLTSHVSNTENPHGVTKTHVGLGNVPNVSTNNQTPTYSDTTTLTTLVSGEKLSVAFAKIKLAITNLINHIANVANPHSVTKAQIGLGNVENKSSTTIRGELTKDNVTNALGYTPPTTNTTYGVATSSTLGLVKSGTDISVDSSGNVSVNDDSHNHIIGNVDGLQTALDQKVPSTRTVNGKTLTTNISLTAGDVGADASGSAAKALSDANAYTDAEIASLIGTAPETRNTLEELSTAISEHESVTDALNAAIGNKVDKVSGKGLSTNDYTTTEKNKLAGIASNAEVNQNAFSNIAVGSTTIAADSKTDTLTFAAGSNITLTPDATNDKITIAAKDTVYTHPTTSGNKHIPSGGSSGQILRWSADGTAAWGADNNTTYSGAGSSLGLVKTGGDVTITDGVITVNDDSHAHIIGNIDGLQSALDGKAASSHGTHVSFSSTAPVVAGTASVGSASTVSRSDHIHPAQTTVSGNAGSATKLATGRAIDGVTFDGSAAITHYGTCSTDAATAAKTVSLTGFTLVTGARVCVKFTVTNTASSPTLNVNSTGAKNIMYRGSAISAGYLAANRVYEFVYDGTDWELVGDINTDTKNTAGSTNSSSKLFLVGATSQAANPQTYSHDTAYVGTDGCLYSNSTKVSVEGHSHAASNITSGTLSSDRLPTVPVAKGGTGATTAAGALTNLGLTATATELNYMDGVTSNVQTQLDTINSSLSDVISRVGDIKYGSISMNNSIEGASIIQCIKNHWESLEQGAIYLLEVTVGSTRIALVQKYDWGHNYGSVLIFGYGIAPEYHYINAGSWTSLGNFAFDSKFANYLPLSGGKMTGEIKIGQGDGYGIQLNTNGKINATIGGSTNCTVLGMYEGEYINVGYPSIPTRIRGSEEYLNYNGAQVATRNDGFSSIMKTVFAPRYTEFDGQSTNTSTYLKDVLKWLCVEYPNHDNFTFFANVNPNSSGFAIINIYSTNNVDSSTGLPQYSSGIYVPLGDNKVIHKFGTYSYNYHFNSITGSPEFSLSGTTLTITT